MHIMTDKILPDGDMNLVWYSTLDNRYKIQIQRIDYSSANLYIFDSIKNNEQIFCQKVSLSYGAIYGPDVNDVNIWKKIIINFIDKEIKNVPIN